jgi:hypothetical protein
MEDGKASDLPSSHPSSHMHSVEKLECFMMECVLYNMPWIALFLLTLCLLQLPVHTDWVHSAVLFLSKFQSELPLKSIAFAKFEVSSFLCILG